MSSIRFLAVIAASALYVCPAIAQPDNKGHGRGNGPPPHAQGGGNSAPGASSGSQGRGNSGPDSFVVLDRDRNAVYSYYRAGYAAGNCPPGLAKKNNGCMPPGQAKKLWSIGRPLPPGVYYGPLPPALLGRLSPAPAGYQYVRVASDILMLAIGTRMVMTAIADLSSF
jgi:hypothetical protein